MDDGYSNKSAPGPRAEQQRQRQQQQQPSGSSLKRRSFFELLNLLPVVYAAESDKQGSREEAASSASPAESLIAIRFADARRGWIAGRRGVIFSTTDGGEQWSIAERWIILKQLRRVPLSSYLMAVSPGMWTLRVDFMKTRGGEGEGNYYVGLDLVFGAFLNKPVA
ncbi:MAG: hypothetical protein WKF84_16305 [Pyrinomonadaceae bacterium]